MLFNNLACLLISTFSNFAEYANLCGALGIRVEDKSVLDEVFQTHRGRCYQDVLTFPGLVHLIRDAVKRAVADGNLGYTKAREVVKVATPETQGLWLEAAKRPRRELEREVKRAKQAARVNPAQGELIPTPAPVAKEVPVRFQVELTPEQEARRAALVERLHKLGGAPTDRAELLLEALAALVESREAEGPRGPSAPVQIHVHDHGDRMTVATDHGEREIGHADAERLKCDAVICKHGERAKTTVPPRVRREVLARDGNRCQAPGCGRTHFLEIHHKAPRAQGGTNDPQNLITLCAACHRLYHQRQGAGLVRESEPAWEAVQSGSGARRKHCARATRETLNQTRHRSSDLN